MFDSQQSINEFLAKYQPDLERLQRLFKSIHSVSDIRYTYNYLTTLPVETTHEFIMHVEAVTTGLVIGYGRLFTASDGTTKLNEDAVPDDLRQIHNAIMSLRHERYAHHGAHDSIETQLHIEFDGTSFILKPELDIIFCLGAPIEWAPLFKWLDEYMFDALQKQIDRLSKISGIEWKMPSGPAPYWVRNEGLDS